jgi:hypothetical protein
MLQLVGLHNRALLCRPLWICRCMHVLAGGPPTLPGSPRMLTARTTGCGASGSLYANDLCKTSARRSAYSWLDISASLSDFSAWMVDEASVVAALSRLSAIYSHLGCGAADHSISCTCLSILHAPLLLCMF